MSAEKTGFSRIYGEFISKLSILMCGARSWGSFLNITPLTERRKIVTLSYLYQIKSLCNKYIEILEQQVTEE